MAERRPRGRPTAGLVLAVLAGALYAANLGGLQLGQHNDDAIHLSVGKSLAAGWGFTRYEDPLHQPEPRYSAGLPALVALSLKLSCGRLAAARWIPWAFSVASVVLAFVVFARRFDGPWPWVLTAAFALNSLVVNFAGIVMTEAPSLCLMLAAVVCLDRLPERERPIGLTLLLAVVLAWSNWIRPTGLLVTAAAGAWLWWRGRRREALIAVAVAGLLTLPWLAVQHRLTGAWLGAGYQTDIGYRPPEAPAGWPLPLYAVWVYARELFPQTLLPFFGRQVQGLCGRLGMPWLPGLGGLLVSLTVLAGAISRRRWADPALWLAVPLAAMLLVWPFYYTRFCLILVPYGLVALHDVLERPWRGRLAAALWVLTIAGFAVRDAALLLRPPSAEHTDLVALGRLIDQATEPEAVIVTQFPSPVGLHSTRHFRLAPPLPPEAGPDAPEIARIRDKVFVYRPNYLLLYSLEADLVPPEPPALRQPPFAPVLRSAPPVGALLYRLGR